MQPDVVASGFVLDGYPRDAKQAALLSQATAFDGAIVVEVGASAIIEKLSSRWLDPTTGHFYDSTFMPPESIRSVLLQRPEDEASAVQKRLATFESHLRERARATYCARRRHGTTARSAQRWRIEAAHAHAQSLITTPARTAARLPHASRAVRARRAWRAGLHDEACASVCVIRRGQTAPRRTLLSKACRT
jgi:hypothetical protein